MGLILLIVTGGVLGWLTSILVRADESRDIMLNVAAGIVGALVAGLASNNGSILTGLSANALLMGLGGSIAALLLVSAIRSRQPG